MIILYPLFHSLPAQITTGNATLGMNTALSFKSGKIFTSGNQSQLFQIGFPCSLSVDSADLFFLSHDCGTCMYYCPCEIVGSTRAFYISKKTINQLGVENKLDLTDTVAFKKIEYTKSCFNPLDSAKCFLPSIALGLFGQYCPTFQWSQPLIVQTMQNKNISKYVLLYMTPQYEQSCDPGPPPGTGICKSYTGSIKVNWFIQNDGTTNFKGIYVAVKSSNTPRVSEKSNYAERNNIINLNNKNLFDILGRKVSCSQLKDAEILGSTNHRIFIDGKSNKILFLF